MNIKQAKQIPIESLLNKLWCNPTKTDNHSIWFLSPFRKEKTSSFKVNKEMNTRYDFGLKEWWDIIKFVCDYKSTDIRGALQVLEGWSLQRTLSPTPKQMKVPIKTEKQSLILLDTRPISFYPLLDYLQERSITRSVFEKYLVQVHFQIPWWSKQLIALGFKNDAGGYEVRNKGFKGLVGKKKAITTINTDSSDTFLVFEGFFDFLAFSSKFRHMKHGFIILNSINGQDEAIAHIQSKNPLLVQFFLDNDEAWRKAYKNISQNIGTLRIEDGSSVYNWFKDFSEYREAKTSFGR